MYLIDSQRIGEAPQRNPARYVWHAYTVYHVDGGNVTLQGDSRSGFMMSPRVDRGARMPNWAGRPTGGCGFDAALTAGRHHCATDSASRGMP